ncbi:hypothetical protein INR49_025115 [Caranx melampygus]|nr:hypothetical protein INR49_025115 [Caranx melampygus]
MAPHSRSHQRRERFRKRQRLFSVASYLSCQQRPGSQWIVGQGSAMLDTGSSTRMRCIGFVVSPDVSTLRGGRSCKIKTQ